MTRRFLTLGLAAALLALGGMNARAADLKLADLLAPGAAPFISGNLEFSDFSYTQTTGTPPAAGDITVESTPASLGTGIEFVGLFLASAGTAADWHINFTVTALGPKINGAALVITGGNFLGTGNADVGETVTWPTPSGGLANRHLETTLHSVSDVATPPIPPQPFVTVTKDITVVGGSAGTSLSVIDQTFGVVPEPTSMALLGIGLSGLFTFRRFLKRAFAA